MENTNQIKANKASNTQTIINTMSFPRNNHINNTKHYPPVIKISYDTNVKSAINFVLDALKHRENILICGLSLAISKVILIAEIVKSKIENIHQINNIDCLIVNDKFDKVKRVPKLDILLSLIEPESKGLGYQAPVYEKIYMKNWRVKDVNEDVSKLFSINKGRRVIVVGHTRKGPKWRLRK